VKLNEGDVGIVVEQTIKFVSAAKFADIELPKQFV
jgi:hypothetical protein